MIEEWVNDAMPYSKAGKARLKFTAEACLAVDRDCLPGVLVECGVWRGGNVMVMRWAAPSRQCWLYDTFAGMTEPGENDGPKAHRNFSNRGAKLKGGGKNAMVSYREVMDNLEGVGVYDKNLCKFIIGDVRRMLTHPIRVPERIAVLRLDTDFYDSTKIELERLYPRLVPGGYLIIDDYGHWEGARMAVHDYFGGKPDDLQMIDYTGAWLRKPYV